MQVIPVIDLKDGEVVHAKQGFRDQYRPIESKICHNADPENVIGTFNKEFGFTTFYIADLNAINKQGDHNIQIEAILTEYPNYHFWLDNGELSSRSYLTDYQNYQAVVGSESLHDGNLPNQSLLKDFVLSLDFLKNQQLGSTEIFNQPELWPEEVILMTLDQVGSSSGPDYKTIEYFSSHYPNKQFIAAGGIRNKNDLLTLMQLGINTALVATALHSGAITADDLAFD